MCQGKKWGKERGSQERGGGGGRDGEKGEGMRNADIHVRVYDGSIRETTNLDLKVQTFC